MDPEFNILIVEDSAIQAEMLRRLLVGKGYKVSVAKNGQEGFAAVIKEKPDIILSDIMMPVMNGYEMCRKLKDSKEMKEVPVILLTQLTETEEVIKGLESGADHYVTKPVDDEFLLSKLEVVLKKPDLYRNDPAHQCIDFDYDGKRYEIRSGRIQTLSYLISTYEDAVLKNRRLELLQTKLVTLNEELERKVEERTASLVKEIEERKRIEEALRSSEERFRTIFENSTDGILLADLEDSKFLTGNKRICDLLGYRLDEIKTLGVTDIHPQEDLPYVLDQFERQAKREFSLAKDMPVKKKDGTVFYADINSFPLDLGGKHYLAGAFRDITDRKLAEERVKSERQRFYNVLEMLPVYLVLLTPDYHISFANRSFRERFGEPGHRRCFEALFNLTEPCETCETYTVLKTKSPHQWEWNGPDSRNYVVFDFPFTDTDGSALILEMGIDITERKQLEEALRLESRRFEAFFENTITPLVFLDKEFNFIRVNKAYADACKRDASEFPGRNHFEMYPSDAKAIFEEVVRTKTAFQTFAHPFIFADHPEWGVTYWDWTLMPILDNTGEVEFLVFSLVDVTERKKSEVMIKSILESVDEGFVIIDPEYRIISANRAYCEQNKSPVGDIIGRHCYEVSHQLRRPCFEEGQECAVRETFRTGDSHSAMHIHPGSDDMPMYVENKSYPMTDATGAIISVIETVNDVTEKRGLEGQLRHAQKMESVGRLAGGVAHDFNNYLTAIIGYGTLLELDIPKDSPMRTYTHQILAAGERAANLTKSLLSFSRKQPSNPMLMDLNDTIAIIGKLLTKLVGEDIKINLNLCEKKLYLMADSGQIGQVLMNLATNARDAMPNRGLLIISTESIRLNPEFVQTHGYGEPGMYALLAVTDTGCGMDEEVRRHIFDPFFTTKEEGKGTGLGLSIVYGIVKQHHGYINVISEPAQGTTFKVYLPLLTSAGAEEKVELRSELRGGTETILIAEDDSQVRNLMRDILGSHGYKVIEATDGEEAVKQFSRHAETIDLLLFDLMMPKLNGWEAYQEIQALEPGAAILYMSGYPMDFIREKGVPPPVENYLAKPVSPEELLRRVREALDTAAG